MSAPDLIGDQMTGYTHTESYSANMQPALAYASYNGGPFNVERWLMAKGAPAGAAAPLELDVFIAEIPFRETANYTRRVLEVQAAYALMYDGTLPRWDNKVDLRVEGNIDF